MKKVNKYRDTLSNTAILDSYRVRFERLLVEHSNLESPWRNSLEILVLIFLQIQGYY